MKRYLIIFTFSVLLLAALVPALPVSGESDIYDLTIRLHVIANSDSAEDQALKLKVRDRLLETAGSEIEACANKSDAEEYILENKAKLTDTAAEVIRENGYGYGVYIETGYEYYPTREYGEVRLPAGKYYSVRVKIGEAAGANWWCVLFPPLCVGAASPKEELAAAGFTPSQIRLLTDTEGKYVIKFKLLELFKNLIKK